MPATLDITHDLGKLSLKLERKLSPGNMNFALSLTVNRLAGEAQAAVKQAMGSSFTIRRPWVVNGIRRTRSTKSNLSAWVYSMDSGGRRDFMALQQEGGIKTPKGDHVAIPMKAAFPNKGALIPAWMKPKALLGQPVATTNRRNGRITLISSGSYKALLVNSKKPGHQIILIKKAGKYIPAWHLAPRAQIDRTGFLSAPVFATVARRRDDVLKAALFDALRD
jgi:hypothetical protein